LFCFLADTACILLWIFEVFGKQRWCLLFYLAEALLMWRVLFWVKGQCNWEVEAFGNDVSRRHHCCSQNVCASFCTWYFSIPFCRQCILLTTSQGRELPMLMSLCQRHGCGFWTILEFVLHCCLAASMKYMMRPKTRHLNWN